jgi:signal transduction histidine kinase
LQGNGGFFGVAMIRLALAVSGYGLAAQQAAAADFFGSDFATLGGVGALVLGLGTCLAIIKIGKLRRSETLARAKIGELEFLLNEAEASHQAEAHVLLMWRSNSVMPDRMTGKMHGTVHIPTDLASLMQFQGWLESDSANMLGAGLETLKQSGRAFNIGIKTQTGDLLEADGRAAGVLATLRFRPLSGERREITELAYDASKLAKQVERLSALLDAAPFPVWIRERDGALQWVNQAYVEASELADIDTVLQVNFELVNQNDIDTSKAQAQGRLIGRANAVLKGTKRALNIHEVPLDQGRAGFAIDVTDLQDNEKELERHIKAHAATLDKLDTAIAIFGPDQRLKFFNNAFCLLWALDENWLRTEPLDGEILDRLRAERLLPEQANYREWRARHLQAYTSLEMQDSYWYLPDGRSLRVISERHPFGGVTYLYENLTREMQLESRYNELFEVQHETLDNLAEAVALFGSDGTIRLFNPAFTKFWNLDPAYLAAKPGLDELTSKLDLTQETRAAWQDIRYSITGLETSRKTIDGLLAQDGLILRYRTVPLPDGNSLITFTDVSDATKAEQALRDRTEALEAADRLKNALLANVSYEVRTPLTSIVGFAETLEFGIAGPLTEKQREYVLDIRKSSEDLKLIIDAIIDLSAIDAGAMELRLQDVDVATLLEMSAEQASPLLTKRKLSVAIEVGADVENIVGDPVRLSQVLGHLLSNAAGFSSPNSTIQMGARRSGEFIQVWVADTGRGMDADFQSKAFERFQAKPLAGSHRGPGLGLALVKSFTELHGGKVSLVSKLDQGTTVVCNLPIAGPKKSGLDLQGRIRNRAA